MNTITKPFLPSDRIDRALSIHRGLLALARNDARQQFSGHDAADDARAQWPGDPLAFEIAQKANVAIASTSSPTALNRNTVSELITLVPASVATKAWARARQFQFNAAEKITVPVYAPSATGIAFAAQGAPLPQAQLDLSAAATLEPMKMGLGFGLTREQAEGANGEPIISRAFAENVTLALDTLFLDTVQGTTTRPAGIRYNIAGLTATANGGLAALIGDLAQLAGAVDAISSNVAYVTSFKEWVKVKAYLPSFAIPVWPSAAVADGVIICIALDALAVCGSSEPIRIERSTEAVVHMETVPQPITSAGTPPAINYPLVSAFQQDLVMVRLIADITWSLLSTSAVSWTSSVT